MYNVRVISQHIMQHLIYHNILHSRQSAYVPNKSTETALARIYNDILANIYMHYYCFLDLSAAFDTLNHSILINRLANAGFTGKALDWLTLYITYGNSCGSIDYKRSLHIHLEQGVPQCSPLSTGIDYFQYLYCPSFDIIDTITNISCN